MSNTRQPVGTSQMSTGGGNRNILNKPSDANGQRDWSHDFLDCLGDATTFCISCCFPCMIYGKNKSRLEALEDSGQAHPSGGDLVGRDCCIHAGLTMCGLGWLLQTKVRGAIRNRYAIQGDGLGDCMAVCCCTPCELTQDSRELELEERSLKHQSKH